MAKPTTTDQALARIADYFALGASDTSHLSTDDWDSIMKDFALAVQFIGRENFVHPRREFCLYLADRLRADFPFIAHYEEELA